MVGWGPQAALAAPLAGGQPDPGELLKEQGHRDPSSGSPQPAPRQHSLLPMAPALCLTPGMAEELMVTHQGLNG